MSPLAEPPFPLLVEHKENHQQSRLLQTPMLWMAEEFLWPFQWPWSLLYPAVAGFVLPTVSSAASALMGEIAGLNEKSCSCLSLKQTFVEVDWNWRIPGRLPQMSFLLICSNFSLFHWQCQNHCPSPSHQQNQLVQVWIKVGKKERLINLCFPRS